MIALDEDALICDFAETYRIYDIYQLPCDYIATLACGLRVDARINMRVSGLRVDLKYLLLAHIADSSAINAWLDSENGRKGKNRPKSFVQLLLNQKQKKETEDVVQFDSGADFNREWERMRNEC